MNVDDLYRRSRGVVAAIGFGGGSIFVRRLFSAVLKLGDTMPLVRCIEGMECFRRTSGKVFFLMFSQPSRCLVFENRLLGGSFRLGGGAGRACAILLVGMVLGLVTLSVGASVGERVGWGLEWGVHPQDGAHADVRIRIAETGVTYNVQINLVFMDYVAPVPRESFDQLDPFEEAPLRDAILEFFRRKVNVVIDGVEVAAVLREYNFRRPGPELLPLFPKTGMRGLLKAHLIFDYPATALPESVAMTWEGYPPDTFTYPARALADTPPLVLAALLTAEGVDKIINFSSTEPEYTWHATGETLADRFLAVPAAAPKRTTVVIPVFSLGLLAASVLLLVGVQFFGRSWSKRRPILAGVPLLLIAAGMTLHQGILEIQNPFAESSSLPSEAEAVEIFTPLHANIYRAFDYTEREEIYDALAQSVDGPLLDALYNEIFRSLIMQDEGGAISRVEAVTLLSTVIDSIGYLPPGKLQPSFTLAARWQVEGSVYHWGHSHTRLNEYAADYTVISTAAGWRIAASRVTEQFRVETPAEETGNDAGDEAGAPFELLPGEDL